MINEIIDKQVQGGSAPLVSIVFNRSDILYSSASHVLNEGTNNLLMNDFCLG